ncbi:helix-turn-helix transcriptional regulator [Staphylospora marina]|uniref:helix-turn-helix transcriptional regulator n=1 Tax=Staphylospora marina TaxID=2490858 RepID=UPI000F5BB917|nr:helix-turn-helix transcriptional regulator [Staphylospora marina]
MLRNRLTVLRAEKGWTQQEVANRLGISRQTVHSVENNKFVPSVLLAFRIARLFGKNVEDIFQYEEEGEDSQ